MTKGELMDGLKKLQANQQSFVINEGVANLWFEHFGRYDHAEFDHAINQFIRANVDNYPASIAKINAWIRGTSRHVMSTRAYDIVRNEQGRLVIAKIKYSVTKNGTIVDEEGRWYADPDDNVTKMLVSRVKSTGMILTEAEAEEEYQALVAQLRRH